MKKMLLVILLFTHSVFADQRYPGEQLYLNAGLQNKLEQEEAAYKQFAGDATFKTRPSTKAEQSFMETFMSFKDFMEEALHNPDWGYYGAGNVEFKQEHFVTVPKQVSPAFGAMLAYQAYAMWRSMIQAGDMTEQEIFNIIEFGAGDGDLAYDIVDSIDRNAQLEKGLQVNTYWQKFYENVKYIIGERAPALCIRQKARNKRFIDAKKCDVINTDAREAKKHLDHTIKGLVLSNELLDTFCLHKLYAPKQNAWKACYLIPLLKKSFFEENNNPILQKYKAIYEERNQLNREIHKDFLKNIKIDDDEMLLSRKDYVFIKSHEKLQGQSYVDWLRLVETYVIDANLLKELQPYFLLHGYYLRHLVLTRDDSRHRYFYVNHSASQFIREASSLLDAGFVLTIDYGDTSMVHDWQLTYHSTAIRMYPERTSCYQEPGSADITCDVNFTDLYFAGKDCGLDVSFYGCQKALQGNFTAIDDNVVLAGFDMRNGLFSRVLSDEVIDYFCNSYSSNMFKMFIQKKVGKGNKYQLLGQSDPLFPAW